MTEGIQYIWTEIEAAALMTRSRGSMTTNDNIKEDADYIVMLGKKIEMQRLEASMK